MAHVLSSIEVLEPYQSDILKVIAPLNFIPKWAVGIIRVLAIIAMIVIILDVLERSSRLVTRTWSWVDMRVGTWWKHHKEMKRHLNEAKIGGNGTFRSAGSVQEERSAFHERLSQAYQTIRNDSDIKASSPTFWVPDMYIRDGPFSTRSVKSDRLSTRAWYARNFSEIVLDRMLSMDHEDSWQYTYLGPYYPLTIDNNVISYYAQKVGIIYIPHSPYTVPIYIISKKGVIGPDPVEGKDGIHREVIFPIIQAVTLARMIIYPKARSHNNRMVETKRLDEIIAHIEALDAIFPIPHTWKPSGYSVRDWITLEARKV